LLRLRRWSELLSLHGHLWQSLLSIIALYSQPKSHFFSLPYSYTATFAATASMVGAVVTARAFLAVKEKKEKEKEKSESVRDKDGSDGSGGGVGVSGVGVVGGGDGVTHTSLRPVGTANENTAAAIPPAAATAAAAAAAAATSGGGAAAAAVVTIVVKAASVVVASQWQVSNTLALLRLICSFVT
jgi:hypothetical protein